MARRVQIIYILVLAGRNSLSTYILQGVLAGFIFGAYGLGLYDSVGYAGLLLLSLLIALSAMVLVGIYAKIFGRGPLSLCCGGLVIYKPLTNFKPKVISDYCRVNSLFVTSNNWSLLIFEKVPTSLYCLNHDY